jgi:glycosyltransferase involved in cell wall biosynthesis
MGETIRVGFVSIDDASSQGTWAGIPVRILEKLNEHPEIHVELISPLKKELKWFYLPAKLREKFTGQAFIWYLTRRSQRYFARQVESVVEEKRLDAVFSTSSIPIGYLRADIPAVFWTDAVFHTMYGYYSGLFAHLSKRTIRDGRDQEERALRRADFACYSSGWAADAAKQFTAEERVKVLPFGANLDIRHDRTAVERWIVERRAERPDACVLLFAGVQWERKGGAIALECARLLNDRGLRTTLRVLGCIPPAPIPSFVEMLGFIDKAGEEGKQQIGEIFRTSDIFILPSRAEAFGIVVCEAAAHGVPALVCQTGGLGETVREGVSGFRLSVQDGGSGFADKARIIMSDYGRFAQGAFAEFTERLNWESSVNILVGLLKEAIEKRVRR